MKAILSILLVGTLLQGPATAGSPNTDRQTKAYFSMEKAERALNAKRIKDTLKLYKTSLGLYQTIAEVQPDWNAKVVRYRVDYCKKQIQKIEEGSIKPKDPPPPDKTGPRPSEAETNENVHQLIQNLGAKSWKTRSKARKELIRIGRPVLPVLAAQNEHEDPEIRLSIQQIIQAIVDGKP
jgi:hypothetical protein